MMKLNVGDIVLSLSGGVFLGVCFSVGYVFAPPYQLVAKSMLHGLLICFGVWCALHVGRRISFINVLIYPLLFIGLYISGIPLLNYTATPPQGGLYPIPIYFWGADWFHLSVILSIASLGCGIAFHRSEKHTTR